ncbi:MAG TPA: AarF/UbiB family protein [Bryobacteraceae bacterium]|nr:AarF/UbiB family protein [Bryobacteraceae bacterium]
MTSVKLSRLSYIGRMMEVMGAVFGALVRFAYRRLRGQPPNGPELARAIFEQLGGSFIKFGQILSLQIDTLPREYCDALLALLDRVPPFPPEQVEQVFMETLHASPRDLFQSFNYEPVASASIGQVHRARLVSGLEVAVKVQRPGIREVFERDNLLLRACMQVVLFLRIKSFYFMRDPVRELSTWTLDELDYRREGSYAKLLGDNAVHTPTERIPEIFWELSAERVLTMQFLEGPSVLSYLRMQESHDQEQLAALAATGFAPEVFSSNVISNFLSDAFRFGVFHADLHPANLLILPNNVVGYVDFGIVATLTPEARRKQIELTLAYASGDPEAIYSGFLNICIVSPDADLKGMRARIGELAKEWYSEPALAGRVRFKVTVTQTMMDLLSVARQYGVLVDREMIKYIRSTILADGLVSRLFPGFDLAHVLRKVVEDYLEAEARAKIFSRGGALSLLADLTIWMQSGPGGLLHALNMLDRGQFRVRAGVSLPADKDSALRMRAVGAAIIWALAMLMLVVVGGPGWWTPVRFPAILAASFLALWTAWLLRLLQRLSFK